MLILAHPLIQHSFQLLNTPTLLIAVLNTVKRFSMWDCGACHDSTTLLLPTYIYIGELIELDGRFPLFPFLTTCSNYPYLHLGTFPLRPIPHHQMMCGLNWLSQRCVACSSFLCVPFSWPLSKVWQLGVATNLSFFCCADLSRFPVRGGVCFGFFFFSLYLTLTSGNRFQPTWMLCRHNWHNYQNNAEEVVRSRVHKLQWWTSVEHTD
jgi:hypothetical protein